jgi:hypothetical protein
MSKLPQVVVIAAIFMMSLTVTRTAKADQPGPFPQITADQPGPFPQIAADQPGPFPQLSADADQPGPFPQ